MCYFRKRKRKFSTIKSTGYLLHQMVLFRFFLVTFSVEEEVDKDSDIGKRNQQSTAKI